MVITRKHDGTPRQTVDLSPLNKWYKQETHNSEPPFHLARRVPRNTWKTVTDTWNGYHSVPLRELDRHLTTFITPFGRWCYKRAPRRFLSSGDGFNRRFEAILADFQRKERIIDDTLIYDDNLEEHWWRTIDLLATVGHAGIVLNPLKFQFAGKSVDFTGFCITDQRIEPLPKSYNTIKDFPTLSSTTDIRSWFVLINQVGNYAQLWEHIEPFCPFLSPKHTFAWTSELDHAFQSSKNAIVEAIQAGVEIFDLHRATCLRTDWSKNMAWLHSATKALWLPRTHAQLLSGRLANHIGRVSFFKLCWTTLCTNWGRSPSNNLGARTEQVLHVRLWLTNYCNRSQASCQDLWRSNIWRDPQYKTLPIETKKPSLVLWRNPCFWQDESGPRCNLPPPITQRCWWHTRPPNAWICCRGSLPQWHWQAYVNHMGTFIIWTFIIRPPSPTVAHRSDPLPPATSAPSPQHDGLTDTSPRPRCTRKALRWYVPESGLWEWNLTPLLC